MDNFGKMDNFVNMDNFEKLREFGRNGQEVKIEFFSQFHFLIKPPFFLFLTLAPAPIAMEKLKKLGYYLSKKTAFCI